MPYKVVKDGKDYRIRAKGRLLPPHYRTRATAERVKRYLLARESPTFRGKR